MDHDSWQRIQQLFHGAVECEPGQRQAFLDDNCAGDLSLRQEVVSLLAAYEKGGFTGAPAFLEGIRLVEQSGEQSMVGRTIGAYEVIREIGRGGMGTVYLASRSDKAFHKEVAIKLIKRGLDTDDVIRRFQSERQILASLDHPNISRIVDGGTTADGLPYFVMEYIQGEPIDIYCDAHKLNITRRLRLFLRVCAAVQHAHQNLVIHRDIKARNILVNSDRVPRLLDFGIAKLINTEPAAPDRTLTVKRRLTPESASPEQIRGISITTATDIYSLGLLLYKLLTGHPPYRLAGKSTPEMERTICEDDPEMPSKVIDRVEGLGTSATITPQSVSETREGSPEALRRRLGGDLDNIVLRALRKEPAQRYSSVEQFAEDVRRHLEGLPVEARRATWRYRAGKFVRRHRAGVAAAAMIVFSLIAGIAATSWQARLTAAEGKRARIEAAKAQRINAFLQDMLSFSSPGYGSSNPEKNPDARVSEVVEQAAKRAQTELADQPEVLAEVLRTIGEVYWAQGRYDQAEPILRAALAQFIGLYGANSRETVEASSVLGNVLGRKGNTAESEVLFRRNIEIERKLAERGDLDVRAMAYTLADYGGLLDQKADKDAESYLREGLQYARQLTGKDRVIAAMLYNDLGDIAYRKGDLNEAERMGRAAIDEYRKLPEGQYVEMAATLSNLGAVLIREGQYGVADPFVREGLELRRKLLGNAHPDTAMSLFRLSDLLYREGDYEAAESAAKESVAVFNRAYTAPKDNIYFANPLMELGLIMDKTGRPQKGEVYLRVALEIRRHLLPSGNQLIGTTEGALGECLTMLKRYAEAEPLLLDSYSILKSTAVEHDSRTTEAVQRLTTLYQCWGNRQKTAEYTSLLSDGNATRR
jgi:serine/threonine protein kinase/tetratricopeptide (TPR) repeat protein